MRAADNIFDAGPSLEDACATGIPTYMRVLDPTWAIDVPPHDLIISNLLHLLLVVVCYDI